ncbi:MAG TPA: hypothetical protein VK943_18365, partial [Arenibaculum sp.]|nr:hypothetical protein [Arenibaculum sp.]
IESVICPRGMPWRCPSRASKRGWERGKRVRGRVWEEIGNRLTFGFAGYRKWWKDLDGKRFSEQRSG